MALIYQVGVPGSLLYMFVVPVLISVTLPHQRKRCVSTHTRRNMRQCGLCVFLLLVGTEGFEWWESVVMARKCLFVLMAIFL